jgi:hypothetical protein
MAKWPKDAKDAKDVKRTSKKTRNEKRQILGFSYLQAFHLNK